MLPRNAHTDEVITDEVRTEVEEEEGDDEEDDEEDDAGAAEAVSPPLALLPACTPCPPCPSWPGSGTNMAVGTVDAMITIVQITATAANCGANS